jgi:ABC-2 type transport system ATP-binding protein
MSGRKSAADGLAVFHRLTVKYGMKTAVEEVSLSVEKGQVYALLGRNGSGKTTMIRCLLGQWRATSGSARLFGEDAWAARERVLARVGVVPEEPDAPPQRTAAELAAFCARLYPRWDDKGVAARLERFGVPANVPFQRLSKGQKGQLALSLALGPLPELLVLDDPTLGLDVVARKELLEELVAELADRGTTVFLTTHDLSGVEGIADRVGILKEGRLVVDEPLEELKGRFRRICWKGSEAPDGPEAEMLKACGMVQTIRDALGCEAIVERFGAGPVPGGAEVLPMSLEEIFIALAGEEGGKS